MADKKNNFTLKKSVFSRSSLLVLLLAILIISFYLYKNPSYQFDLSKMIFPDRVVDTSVAVVPFPVGIDPVNKIISEQANLTEFLKNEVASNHFPKHTSENWWQKIQSQLVQWEWYQNLASSTGRIIVVQSGEKASQVTNNISKVMGWDQSERDIFQTVMADNPLHFAEGVYYPGKYTVAKGASPIEVAAVIKTAFQENIVNRFPAELVEALPLTEVLTFASLLEREAYDFDDMRTISGIIWNRQFIDMKLQLDATMQYAKAERDGLTNWPQPLPADKNIDSPYNTYKYAGLPPGPIANPSIDAVIAALNPRETKCFFYFHDNRGNLYCNETYAGHQADLKRVFPK